MNHIDFFEAKAPLYPYHVFVKDWVNTYTKDPNVRPGNIKEYFGFDHCSVVLRYNERIFMFEKATEAIEFEKYLARVGE